MQNFLWCVSGKHVGRRHDKTVKTHDVKKKCVGTILGSNFHHPLFDAVAESEVREVLKSLVSNIWLHYVSVMRPDVPLK